MINPYRMPVTEDECLYTAHAMKNDKNQWACVCPVVKRIKSQ